MKTILTFLTAACAVAALLAQAPPAGPSPADWAQHQLQFLTTVLSLTSTQQQQATNIFSTAATAETSVHDSMKTAHKNLNNAVKNNDSAAIDQWAGTIGQLTSQITSIKAKADAAFYQILTADQQSKLNQLQSQGPKHGMGFVGPPIGLP